MRAFIFAAGLGTRLYPYTKTQAKAMVSILGKPMLEHLILKLKSMGMIDIIINVHHYGDQIISFLEKNENFGCQITIADEREALLDTGGGLKKALALLNDSEDLLVHNVDVLTDFNILDLIKEHKASNAIATLLVQNRNTSRYLLFNSKNELEAWVNIKTGETKPIGINPKEFQAFAFNGVHIVNKSALAYFPEESQFPIIPVYLNLSQETKIKAMEMDKSFWLDLGKPEAIDKAEKWMSI